MPADIVVAGIDGVADAALDLDAEHERVQELRSRDRRVLRQREDRRRDRAGRVDHGLEMRVVEVERVRRDAVHQRRVQDVEPLAAAEHGGLRGPENGASAASARFTVSWRDAPTAQPTQFSNARLASCMTAGGMSVEP